MKYTNLFKQVLFLVIAQIVMSNSSLAASPFILDKVSLESLSSTQKKSNSPAQEKAIKEVTRLGGVVEFDETLPNKPIVKIDLHDRNVTDQDLEFLEGLTELKALDLRLTKISDEGVKYIKTLTNLQTLNLFKTGLSDKGLTYLKDLKNLQTLLIGGTKVTNDGLVHLKPFTKLKKLSLFKTQVSDNGLASIKDLVTLETLLIGGTAISQDGIKELQETLPKLRFSEM